MSGGAKADVSGAAITKLLRQQPQKKKELLQWSVLEGVQGGGCGRRREVCKKGEV